MDIEREQHAYRTSKPSRLGRGIERLTHPLGKTLADLVPSRLVRSVLKGIDRAVGMPALVEFDHDIGDLIASHRAAKRVSRVAQGASASTGAAAGLGGALSMSADIPATLAIALRSIRDTGRAYGFDGEGDGEKMFRLRVLELAALNDEDERRERIAELESGIDANGALLGNSGETIAPLVDQAVERISRALAFSAVRSRLGMVVPLAGSVVGGVVNSSFQSDVGKAARFAFQARALKREKSLSAS